MTKDEAEAIRGHFETIADEAVRATAIGLLDEVLMWQDAGSYASVDDLRRLARVARGERQAVAPMDVEETCECHCCKRFAKAAERTEAAEVAARRRAAWLLLRGGRR